ncbi:OmpA family protein [Flavobacterium sp.]|uniref:OmpA family protein n=1 Tax=Flavobacterium sp. TaxID=239 RepID=UPI00374CDDE5
MKLKLIIICAFLSFSSILAQKAKIESADKKYNDLAYINAIEIYQKVAEKGYKSVDLFQKLGNANYFNANLSEAAKWYGQLFNLGEEVDKEYYYRYSLCLKSIGDYKKAEDYLYQFSQKSGADVRASIYKANQNYISEIKANSGRFKIEDAGINTVYSDYGAALNKDKFVYTSARDTSGASSRKHTWTGQSFSNLFTSQINGDGVLLAPERMASKVNSKFNESTAVFTKDGNTMYFTRNNFNDGKRKTDAEGTTKLKLYKATLENYEWKNIVELPFNSDLYSVAHPALSPDEKTLYFASNMPGTVGLSDIFKVTINDDDTYSTPVNLGNPVNTEGRETFPFVSDNNELYFASDGQLGLGGLDVFVTKMAPDGTMSKVFNLGTPINGPQDDFAFLIESKSKLGFFTSNRDGGKGNDDIYKLFEQIPLQYDCKQNLSGVVTDKETTEIIPNAKVTLYDDKMVELKSIFATEKGEYSFADLECEKQYFVRSENKDFDTVENSVVTGKVAGGDTFNDLIAEKRIKTVKVGSDLAKTFNIKIIYFDLDKSNIRQDAALELEKILAVMQQNPRMKVDVRSHTDSRQTASYNEKLSDRRAKSTIAWLVKNGINISRLSGKGYGESQLVNKCADGIECSEEEHQANRRSEFVIISM